MALPLRTPLKLKVDKSDKFKAGDKVIALYSKMIEGKRTYRCCLDYKVLDPYSQGYADAVNTRFWVHEEDIDFTVTCSCGSTSFTEYSDVNECNACGNILVGGTVIPNKVTPISRSKVVIDDAPQAPSYGAGIRSMSFDELLASV